MKKRLFLFLLATLFLLGTVACTDKDVSGDNNSETGKKVETDNEKIDEKPDYEKIYGKILNEYYEILSTDTANNDFSDEKFGLWELIDSFGEDNDLIEQVGYYIEDISGDDIPELLIIENTEENPRILNLYTVKNKRAYTVLEGNYHNQYFLIQDNHIFNLTSADIMSYFFGEFKLSENARELIGVEAYFSAPELGMENGLYMYHNKTGEHDVEKSEAVHFPGDEWNKVAEDMYKKIKKINFTPFSKYELVESDIPDNKLLAKDGNYVKEGESDLKVVEVKDNELEDLKKIGNYVEYYVEGYNEEETGKIRALFTVANEVKDFSIFTVKEFNIDDDGVPKYDKEKLYSTESLTPDRAVVFGFVPIGDTPQYGVTYTDSDAKERSYLLDISGKDGSLYFVE